jgi:phage gp36-like protein
MAVCTGRLNVSDEMRNRYQEYDIQMLDDWTYGYIHITADAATGELVAETSRTEFNGNAD